MTENPESLAQALAPQPAPEAPEALKPEKPAKLKGLREPWRWGRIKNQALILETSGDVEVHSVKETHVRTASGAYTPLAGKRFYLRESVGPGWVSVFTSGNPEPITTVPPVGFGSAFWSQLVGGKLLQLAFGAFEAPDKPFTVKPWMRWVLLAIAGLVLVGVFVYEFTHTGKTPGR